jgi:transposase-like protein
MQPGPVGTRSAIAGSSTRPTVKVAGRWRHVYRAIDQHGQIIEVYVSPRRDTRAARRFFATALGARGEPTEVVTDRAPALRAAIYELMPAAFHHTEQYANDRIECDHAGSKPGSDRCGASNATTPQVWSCAVTR